MTPHILIIDDNAGIRETFSAFFHFYGWSVEQAQDGQEGLEKYAANPEKFSAISLDIDMPRMSGPECLPQLLEVNPQVPVIMISSHAPAVQQRLCKGASAFLQKPVDYSLLLAVFTDCLSNSEKPL